MASVILGGGVAAASGSVGGTVFSRNAAGPYLRNRSIPVNPATAFQVAVRNLLSQLTSGWVETLSDAQRELWETYAENVLLPGPLGNDRNIGALAHYVRSNVSRLQADPTNLPRVDAGPGIFDLGTFTNPTLADYDPTGQDFELSFDDTDAWANEDDAAMLVYVSRPKNKTVNYFNGPYRFAAAILGDGTTPPTSPATISLPFTALADQKIFVQARVTRADGRLSSSFRGATEHSS